MNAYKVLGYGIPTKHEMEQLINNNVAHDLISNELSTYYGKTYKGAWIRNDKKKANECEILVADRETKQLAFEKRNPSRVTNSFIFPVIYIIKANAIEYQNQASCFFHGAYFYITDIHPDFNKEAFICIPFIPSYAYNLGKEPFDSTKTYYFRWKECRYNKTSPKNILFEDTDLYHELKNWFTEIKRRAKHSHLEE